MKSFTEALVCALLVITFLADNYFFIFLEFLIIMFV